MSDFSTVHENSPLLCQPTGYGRRAFLSTTLVTVGMLVAGIRKSEGSTNLLSRLPEPWLRTHGRAVYDYANFIERLRLRNLDTMAVLRPHFNKRGSVQNVIPDKRLWRNIVPTLKVTDRLAKEMRKEVVSVTSVYRSPPYNRMCGGKSRSYHMRNNAIDVKFACSPWQAAQAARNMRSRGYFRGGIGKYSSFVHIDTRGTNVDW